MRTLRGVSELFIGILGFASTGRWTALAGDSVSAGWWGKNGCLQIDFLDIYVQGGGLTRLQRVIFIALSVLFFFEISWGRGTSTPLAEDKSFYEGKTVSSRSHSISFKA